MSERNARHGRTQANPGHGGNLYRSGNAAPSGVGCDTTDAHRPVQLDARAVGSCRMFINRPRLAGGEDVSQLWLFWIAPILGAAIAGFVTRWLHEAADTV